MNISLRQLRAFLAVAESRNFSRAGELMALTQPAWACSFCTAPRARWN
jgi:DNA-binding transcriptional LysR family regulator